VTPRPGPPRSGRQILDFPDGPAAFIHRVRGEGPPLLLLHGFAGDALSWQFNLTALAAGRSVLAVDLPGHGLSTLAVGPGTLAHLADWVERMAATLALPPGLGVVGHSMGARLALELAGRHPQRVGRISLLACAGLGTGVDLAVLRRMLAADSPDRALSVIDGLFGRPSPLREALARALAQRMADPAARQALDTLLAGAHDAIAAGVQPFDWTRVAVPVQMLWGTRDRVVPAPPADALPPAHPLHLLEGVGHLPHVEAASPVNDLIRSFHP